MVNTVKYLSEGIYDQQDAMMQSATGVAFRTTTKGRVIWISPL